MQKILWRNIVHRCTRQCRIFHMLEKCGKICRIDAAYEAFISHICAAYFAKFRIFSRIFASKSSAYFKRILRYKPASPPVGLGRHVGPSLAIPRKFPAIILGTESHDGNSKKHNYPRPQNYSLLWGSPKDITGFAHDPPPGASPLVTAGGSAPRPPL